MDSKTDSANNIKLDLIETKKRKKSGEYSADELSDMIFSITVIPLAVLAQHPTKNSLVARVLSCIFYCMVIITLTTLSSIYIAVYTIEITNLSQLIASFGLYVLGILKIFPLLYYNKVIVKLVKNKERFWSAGVDPVLDRQVTGMYRGAYNGVNSFNFLVGFTLLLFNIRPVFDKGSMPVLCWYPKGYYGPLLVLQGIASTMLSLLVVGFNGLFLITITDLRTQFRILNWNILNQINDGSDNDLKMMIKFVKQHRFLTSNVKDVEKIFMLQILSLYILTIVSCCMELYALAETPLLFSDKCRTLFYLSSLIVQLGMFCFPAGELTNEMFMLSQSFYLYNWEDGSRALQTWLPFVQQVTQQVFDFKAMGLITINKMAMIDVAKSTMSFLTLMRDMK